MTTMTAGRIKSKARTTSLFDGGTSFLRPRLPASASIGMMIMNRPSIIAKPIVVLYHLVFADMPAKAEPLLPVPDT